MNKAGGRGFRLWKHIYVTYDIQWRTNIVPAVHHKFDFDKGIKLNSKTAQNIKLYISFD